MIGNVYDIDRGQGICMTGIMYDRDYVWQGICMTGNMYDRDMYDREYVWQGRRMLGNMWCNEGFV